MSRKTEIAVVLSVALLGPACSVPETPPPTEVDVVATEWNLAIDGPVTDGWHGFNLFNRGEMPHEFGIAPLPEPLTADAVMEELRTTGTLPDGVNPIGILGPAAAGQEADRRMDLFLETSKRYLFACFLPVEGGPDAGRPHALLGMYGELTT